jgi:hypothetical protein
MQKESGRGLLSSALALVRRHRTVREGLRIDPLDELPTISQVPGQGFRRWFRSGYFDLVMWYESRGGQLSGFQLCYQKGIDEHALTWRRESGFDHKRVDDGDDGPSVVGYKGAPVLVRDGVVDIPALVDHFILSASGIDKEVFAFVLGKLRDYQATEMGRLDGK